MPFDQVNENWKLLQDLIKNTPSMHDEHVNILVKHYIEQNMQLLNDVISTSIDNYKRLQKARTANDIICTQARFSDELSKKITLSTQRFLNASLGQIADYNEWLKAHCDFATD